MSVVAIVPKPQHRDLLQVLRSAATGIRVEAVTEWADVAEPAATRLVVVEGDQAADVVHALRAAGSKARVIVLSSDVNTALLEMGLHNPQVTGLIAYLNVPRLVLEAYGNPLSSEFEIPQDLRGASYAIVAAGPNKLFGDADEAELLASSSDMQRRYAENLGLSVTRLASDAGYREEAVEAAREDNIVEVGS